MTPLYIVGSGGAGKEIYFLVEGINNVQPTFDFQGFVDFEAEKISIGNRQYEVFEEDQFLTHTSNPSTVAIAIGLGDPKLVRSIAKKYKSRGFQFPNLIHPSAGGHWSSIQMGSGNLICAGNLFELDIEMGSFNFFNLGSILCHDCRVGSYNVFSPRTTVCGTVQIGDGNFFGCSASILPNLSIGNGNTIGAGALVTKGISDQKLMVGSPAKATRSSS